MFIRRLLMATLPDDGEAGGGGNAEGTDDSLRADLERAFDETPDTDDVSPPDEKPALEVPEFAKLKADDKPVADKSRDETGKFRKRETSPPDKPAKAEEKPAEKPVVADQAKLTPPQSWKPAVRDHWAKIPAEVQQEIHRREREIATGLRDAAQARKFTQDFYDVVSPFAQFIEADRATPLQAVQNLMRTSATLRVGTPMQKAQTAAEIIRNFGVDIAMLDGLLAGQNVNSPLDPIMQAVDQRLAPVNQLLQQLRQNQGAQQQQLAQAADTDIETFAADAKNEFFLDVKDTMADLLEIAAKQGKKLDLQTAYNRAILMHDDIAEVVQERSLRSRAEAASAAARNARRKSVSISGAPDRGEAEPNPNASLRDDIESSIARLQE